MRTVSLKEMQKHLGQLIEDAVAGQEVVVVSTTGSMVRLVPCSPGKFTDPFGESKEAERVGHALDRFMGTWTAEEEAEVLVAVEFLDHMDESQRDRIPRFLEELEQEKH